MKITRLKTHLYMARLDRRSPAYPFFKFRVETNHLPMAYRFNAWAQENLGLWMPWNIFYKMDWSTKTTEEFPRPNWAIRSMPDDYTLTEFFLTEDVAPTVLLHWQEQQ